MRAPAKTGSEKARLKTQMNQKKKKKPQNKQAKDTKPNLIEHEKTGRCHHVQTLTVANRRTMPAECHKHATQLLDGLGVAKGED